MISDDRDFLAEARRKVEEYLVELHLQIHPIKSQLFETRHGASFVGFRILPDRIRVRAENLQRARRRLRRMGENYRCGLISLDEITQSVRSWIAHLEHGDTFRLRDRVFGDLALARG